MRKVKSDKLKKTLINRSAVISSLITLASLMTFAPAYAEDESDLNALALADKPVEKVAASNNWRTFVEGAAGISSLRSGAPAQGNQRLSFDTRYDGTFAPGWRAVFADRLDASWPAQTGYDHSINTVKEAYVSWQATSTEIVDVGRVNVRNGAALGYNPTDYFKVGAVRSAISVDPASLKENRQGTVVVNGQTLWTGGSMNLLYSPRLQDHASTLIFNPNLGATNAQDRWLFTATHKVGDNLTPQFLLYKSSQSSPQVGINLTGLINDGTVGFFEWSGGRSPSALTAALQQQGVPVIDDSQFRHRFAGGLTYTTDNKISLTAEIEYNGAGMKADQWNALRNGSPLPYKIYLSSLQTTQESPTQWAAFFYGTWKDAIVNNVDLSAMAKLDLVDRSRMFWVEARYHYAKSEVALQWQRNVGGTLSTYGVIPQSQSIQLVARQFF